MRQSAIDLFLRQRRFDLIYKYLYIAKRSNFVREAYLESIRSFNGFYEQSSDGSIKDKPDIFVSKFDDLINSIIDGFDSSYGSIPIGLNGDIVDGGHRLAVCAFQKSEVETQASERQALWNYEFFQQKGMSPEIMDFGALEYVKLNPHAYIVNLQPVTNPDKDGVVISILEKYGFVYYKKDVWITYNGLVNLKKISYGSFWERASWIGNAANKYAGARNHASRSMGRNPLRVFVFVCESIDDVVRAKNEIRELYGIGNYSVHINDTHDEAVCLAENYFNENTLFQLNTRPFQLFDKEFENHIDYLKTECEKNGVDLDKICGAGSTPLNVFQIRHSQDLDYLTLDSAVLPENEIISSHNKYFNVYPYSVEDIITTPRLYMYFNGIKFISLEVLKAMKDKRNEAPKDIVDCKSIRIILFYKELVSKARQRRLCRCEKTLLQYKVVKVLYKYNNTLGNVSIKASVVKKWRELKRDHSMMAKINRKCKRVLCLRR